MRKTDIQVKSERRKRAIKLLVENGEYSIPYAMMKAEDLNDEGKLLDNDYEELMEYLESLLEPVETVDTVETVEDAQVEENASYTEQDASMQHTEDQTNDESEEQ